MQDDEKQKLTISAAILIIKILIASIYGQTEVRLNCLDTAIKELETFTSRKSFKRKLGGQPPHSSQLSGTTIGNRNVGWETRWPQQGSEQDRQGDDGYVSVAETESGEF